MQPARARPGRAQRSGRFGHSWRTWRRRAPALLVVFASVAATALLLALAGAALAASPSPSGAVGGDPRSSGQGPGLVGDPLAAIVAVAVVALASLAATLLYVRLTGGPKGARPRR
jgi:hypothetical protein